MSDDQKIDGQAIKEMSVELKRPIETLLALARQNDPFYAGATPATRAEAEWFAELYDRFEFGRGSHLRRVHYRLISQETPILLPDGVPYENTETCWKKLSEASKHARYLGLVPIDDFEDHRNPEPTLYLPEPVDEPSIDTDTNTMALQLPRKLPVPSLVLNADCPTPCHLEIWCEKSTVDDVLDPLGRQYGLNLQTGLGELSVSLVRDLVTRVLANGDRPVRIIYVSDFDPGGQSMPVAVARKIEWFLRNSDSCLDIQLQPIALTHAQCLEYELPRTPIKETETRAAAFEARYGEGATELDALEALHPGELRNILVAEIERFLDPEFEDHWSEFEDEAQEKLGAIEQAELGEHADDLAVLQARLDALRDEARELEIDLSIINETIRAGMMSRAQGVIGIDLDVPEPCDADEWEEPLFDSARDYVEQIDAYKAFQGKPTGRKTKKSE